MAPELPPDGVQLRASGPEAATSRKARRVWPAARDAERVSCRKDARLAALMRANKNAAPVSRSGVLYSNIERGRFLVLGRPGSDLLSQGLSHSTIGAEEFNGRVRDGIGLRLFARTTRPAKDKKTKQAIFAFSSVANALISWTLKMRAIKPIERLVPVSCMHYCTSTSGLSTWSSSTVLKGMLVLRWVSRLDAFSGYPVRT